jgi:vacuolar-type H+-ATPase subunit E/Vma4
MLSEDLLNKINKALKAIDGTDSDQQRLNEEFIEKIDSANQKCSDEAIARSAKDESHDSQIAEIQATISAFNDAITAMEAALDAIRSASYDMLAGATETEEGSSGMVPTPLAGEQEHVLTGNAQWTPQGSIKAGMAENDENGVPITQYIKDITFDEENKKLVLTRGNAETKEIPLAE